MEREGEHLRSPEITDYGSLADLTGSVGLTGQEDGAGKLVVHHTGPSSP